ncbi:hypothetical protein NIES4071_76950 [Calothrix sp. NIES-4071]|nr:hypothetical protein NIES4071_76950 [Calothrix sp. NIES-4071]BAZ61969.1 hypothetical protein NIES4105_76890 [Calothrix sp. NIES-4105]
MPKVRIELLNVTESKTEDISTFGLEDKFYIKGALSNNINTQLGCTAHRDNMQPGEVLNPSEFILSANGQYTFVYQGDGNLVLYQNSNNQPLWISKTRGKTNGMCIMHSDGNFVIYDWDANPIWSSDTSQHPGSYLVVENDGNVVIYRPDGTPVWSINTCIG